MPSANTAGRKNYHQRRGIKLKDGIGTSANECQLVANRFRLETRIFLIMQQTGVCNSLLDKAAGPKRQDAPGCPVSS